MHSKIEKIDAIKLIKFREIKIREKE